MIFSFAREVTSYAQMSKGGEFGMWKIHFQIAKSNTNAGVCMYR